MPRIPVTTRNADPIFTSTPFEAKTLRWPPGGHNIRCRKISDTPRSKSWSIVHTAGRSFRIYRLAKKERERGDSERALSKQLTGRPGRGVDRGLSRLGSFTLMHPYKCCF